MAEVLLTLVMPNDVARHVEDLLLSRPDLINGFTASSADGHGSGIKLVEAAELVSGHAARTLIQTAGPEDVMRQILLVIKHALPCANIFFWITPIIEIGRL
jgi:hypothetical protein